MRLTYFVLKPYTAFSQDVVSGTFNFFYNHGQAASNGSWSIGLISSVFQYCIFIFSLVLAIALRPFHA